VEVVCSVRISSRLKVVGASTKVLTEIQESLKA